MPRLLTLQEAGPVGFDLRPWPMLLLAVEERELEHAREYAAAVGGEEVDLREHSWFADDLAGGFVVEGGYTLDAMGATTAMAEAARRAGVEFMLGCEAKRLLVEIEAERGDVLLQLLLGLFECDEDARLAVIDRAPDEELHRHERLARSRTAADQRRPARRKSAARDLVESIDARR